MIKNSVPKAKHFRFGVVVWMEWSYNWRVIQWSRTSILENKVPAEHIIRWNVPGSFELIYGCKKMLQTQNVDAVIAIGSVIQGKPNILILYVKVLLKG
jgi:6,7-dimethyl-8-ribityllumazine synthase